jgi:hypothetical protein
MTCSGIVSSAPFSIVVTGSRAKVRPSFSVAQRGPVAALISPPRKSLRLLDQLEIHELEMDEMTIEAGERRGQSRRR